MPKRVAWRLSPLWRRAIGAAPAPHLNGSAPPPGDDHHLESLVDVHAFVPEDLERHARAAGFTQVRVGGEELLANWFGWFNRTLEASADPRGIPMPWIRYAYHGYLLLQGVDRRLLEGRLPPQLFYNLMLAAVSSPTRARAAGASRPRTRPARSSCCTDRRAMFDTGIGPVAFVTVNALAGLETAAAVAVGLSVLVGIERLVRRKPVTNALGGVLGTGHRRVHRPAQRQRRGLLRAAHALRRRAGAGVRRLGGDPAPAGRLPGRRAVAGAVGVDRHTRSCGARSRRSRSPGRRCSRSAPTVYAVLIAAGKAGWLAAASIAMGWPAFLLLLYASYRYLPRRLAQLGAPERPTD